MNVETKEKLLAFGLKTLKQEILARGSSAHAAVAAAMALKKMDLGGNADLANYSSKDIADAMREGQKAIYGVDDRKDAFEITDQRAIRNAESVVSLFRGSR